MVMLFIIAVDGHSDVKSSGTRIVITHWELRSFIFNDHCVSTLLSAHPFEMLLLSFSSVCVLSLTVTGIRISLLEHFIEHRSLLNEMMKL